MLSYSLLSSCEFDSEINYSSSALKAIAAFEEEGGGGGGVEVGLGKTFYFNRQARNLVRKIRGTNR